MRNPAQGAFALDQIWNCYISHVIRALVALVIVALIWTPSGAHAQTPPTVPVAIVPADGNVRGVQLRAQAVDVVIRQDKNGLWADTSFWVQLHNPGRQDVAVPVALSGPQKAPGDLPADLTLRLNKTLLALEPLPQRDGQPQVGPTTAITIPVRGSVILRAQYRQALSAANEAVTYFYPLTAAARWPGTPESLRVTIRFATPVVPEQILEHVPPPSRYEPDGMTWLWEYKKATQDVGLTFVTFDWWAGLTADRAAAGASSAGLTERLALASRYRYLADLPASPLAGTTDLFERYYPQAVAELQTGIRYANPTDPALASAHVELAALYRQRAERSTPAEAQAYLQMAATELQAAAVADSSDPAVRTAAADLYAQLAASADARGDAALAEQHRARQAALRAPGPARAPSDEALTQAALLAQAATATGLGDLPTARVLIGQAFGPAAATLADAPPPAIGYARVTVTSRPEARTITLELGPDGDAAALAEILARAAAALTPLAEVETGPNRLTLALTGMAPAEWLTAQARLAAALPPLPELALLADVLRPRALAWHAGTENFRHTERYVEFVDLTATSAAWEAQARRSEQLIRTQAGATEGLPDWLDAAQRARLADIQRTLWAADAAAWRALAGGSGAEYRVTMGLARETREWAVPAGTARQLGAEASAWREDRLAWAAGGAALLLVLLALAAWRLV